METKCSSWSCLEFAQTYTKNIDLSRMQDLESVFGSLRACELSTDRGRTALEMYIARVFLFATKLLANLSNKDCDEDRGEYRLKDCDKDRGKHHIDGLAKDFAKLCIVLFVGVGILSLAGPAPLWAEETVVVEGVATSRDAALDRALRDAVRQGAGVDINSLSSLIANEDREEFREQTVSATMGSVTSYQILATSQDKGVWRVKVKATVSKKQVGRPQDVSIQNAKVIVIARRIMRYFPEQGAKG